MSRLRAAAVSLLALGLALPVQAQPAARVVSPGPEKVAIAIYQDPAARDDDFTDYESYYFDGETGLAQVSEWRTIDLPAGDSIIRFEGVAEGIVPQTAAVEGLPARLVERNQDFDLISPGSLIAKSVDQRVTRVRTNRVTGKEVSEQAVLRSGPEGMILDFDGRLEALDCSGGPERLVFDHLPPELSDHPTLSLRVLADKPGRHRVRLSYMTVGVLWAANYVAKLNGDGTLDLTGWITLKNDGRTGFADALTQVVAGDVERDPDTTATVAQVVKTRSACWPMDTTTRGRYAPPAPPRTEIQYRTGDDSDGDVGEVIVTGSRIKRSEFNSAAPIQVISQEALVSNLGDYKLYTLPSATTVAANQTKQVLMLQRAQVKYERLYIFRIDPGDEYEPEEAIRPATVMFRTKNTVANGLGLSLPGGKLKVMARDAKDRPLLAGDGQFRNTGLGAPLEMDIDRSTEVEVIPRLVGKERPRDDNTVHYSYEVEVINHRAEPSSFELRMNSWDKFKVSKASPRFAMKPAGAVWALKLKPGERKTIRYRVTVFD